MPSMTVKQMFFPVVKKVVLSTAAVFALMQCSEEEVAPSNVPATEISISAASAPVLPTVTVTGVNTVYATAKDCSTCTYIIPAGSTVVDGKELNLKPGSVVCINTLFKYGNLELVNVEGTSENPITITTVGESLKKSSSVQDVTAETSSVDPY